MFLQRFLVMFECKYHQKQNLKGLEYMPWLLLAFIYIKYFNGFTMFHRKTLRPFSVTRILHVMAYRVCSGNGGTLEKRPRFLSEMSRV